LIGALSASLKIRLNKHGQRASIFHTLKASDIKKRLHQCSRFE
jgi:hypothetical protein